MYNITSPNFDNRPDNILIDTIIVHHTNMINIDSAIDKLCDKVSKVSCHYVIGKDGIVYRLVDDTMRAWHAGISFWRGKSSLNDRSIGIELDNDGVEPFKDAQIQSLIALCSNLKKQHPIQSRNIISHSDVAYMRKDDPHNLFDWELLAKNDIGLYPGIKNYKKLIAFKKKAKIDSILNIQKKLKIYGYLIEANGIYDNNTKKLITAFKRHFCASTSYLNAPNIWDQESDIKLNILIEMINNEN